MWSLCLANTASLKPNIPPKCHPTQKIKKIVLMHYCIQFQWWCNWGVMVGTATLQKPRAVRNCVKISRQCCMLGNAPHFVQERVQHILKLQEYLCVTTNSLGQQQHLVTTNNRPIYSTQQQTYVHVHNNRLRAHTLASFSGSSPAFCCTLYLGMGLHVCSNSRPTCIYTVTLL